MLASWDTLAYWVAGILEAILLWKFFELSQRGRRRSRQKPIQVEWLESLNEEHRAWLANGAVGAIPDIGLVCPKCRYSLTGLVSRACPECGGAFSFADLVASPYRPRI